MAAPLHVLVYGSFDGGACDVYRFGMHVEALAREGVELRAMTTYRLADAAPHAGLESAIASRDVVLDRSELDWADVIVLRRFYLTRWSCADCAFGSDREARLVAHRLETGHQVAEPDRLIRPLYGALERHPELLRGRALVYESDDDLLNVQPWNGMRDRIAPERDLIERMVRRADLVTVTTPVLAGRHARLNPEVRVVRNAVDPAWYATAEAPRPPGDPRLVYYAKPNRMRDYAVCRPAVDDLVAAHPTARRVWLGALDAPAGGPPDRVIAAVDEVGPYVASPRAFARSLAASRPDIGLAPLVGDPYDQAKSELHWLEYTMAGAATVASSIPGGGPFDVIRDGVDGLLAGDAREWREALGRLAASRALREDIAGRARERVLRDYTVTARAPEWADAYRWAAEHAGHGVEGRVHGLGALPATGVASEGAAALAHRRVVRERTESAPESLSRLRGARTTCWGPAAADHPLVTVVLPVIDEPAPVVGRAVASALAGSYARVEVLVAVDPGRTRPAQVPAGDPRVRLVPVPGAGDDLPAEPVAARRQATARLVAGALAAASGAWIAPLSPEAVFEPDHVEVLLAVAIEHELEFVYGQAVFDAGPGVRAVLGAWPPNPDGVLTLGTELISAPLLGQVAVPDPESWRDALDPGWALWSALLAAGVRAAGIEHPVSRAHVDDPEALREAVTGGAHVGTAPERPAVRAGTRDAARDAGHRSRKRRGR